MRYEEADCPAVPLSIQILNNYYIHPILTSL